MEDFVISLPLPLPFRMRVSYYYSVNYLFHGKMHGLKNNFFNLLKHK